MAGSAGLIAVLESDFRQLAHDARKVEGFAGFFTGSDHHPEVKEAAERAVLKVRSLAEHPNPLEAIRNSKEVLRPLQLSCETKSSKLISQSLSTLQKLLSNDALSPASTEAVTTMMAQVEKVHDENVKLKTLQLALTLLQSPLHPTTEDGIAAVLGVCFRTFSQKSAKDTVSSTAAATVRQAVAIVFSYVDVQAELERLKRAQQAQQEAAESGGTATTTTTTTGVDIEIEPPSPALLASQKLLEDLIAIALGAPPTWLKAPSLPRTFVIEVLDFGLSNSASLFRALPDFESTLSLRISQLLQAQLQDYLDAGAAGAALAVSTFPTFKATLRCMRTLLKYYYPQLGGRCGTLVQTILRGLSSQQPLFQRIAVAQLMKQLLGEPSLVYYLFSTYDMQKERKLDAVHALVRGSIDVIDYALKGGQDGTDAIAINVANLYQTKATSKEWVLDTEFDTVPASTQLAYFTMLAIDSLMAFLSSVERLTSASLQESVSFPKERGGSMGIAPPGLPVVAVEREVCEALIARTWRSTLAVLTQALARWSGEELMLHLLKGYQVITQASGLLQMEEPRDAFLGVLCDFALASHLDRGANDTDSPRSIGSGSSSPRRTLSSLLNDEDFTGAVLSNKNVQAIRTLFNIAHRLSPILGSGWALVLETMNTLDRVLDSPKTKTHEVASGSGTAAISGDLAILSAAASQLFESTRDMESEAVMSLLSGLRDVSLKHLPLATQMGAPKMFALNRMVEVLLYNMHRIQDLWAIFLGHVLEIVGDPKPPVRAAAIDALGRAIVGTLGSLGVRRAQTGPGVKGHVGPPPPPSPSDSTGGIEHMLLVALEALHNDERERDVRAGVLRVLLNVLQRHGERLTDGWTPVFRLLAVVPEQEDPETVDLGFQCVQLVASDYMSAMPLPRLRRCLQVIVLYGRQQADLNVSLSTISMLWNATDMLGRSLTNIESKAAAAGTAGTLQSTTRDPSSITSSTPPTTSESPVNGENEDRIEDDGDGLVRGSQFTAVYTLEQVEEMQQMVFGALQNLAQDPRPEVRNSGVRTLFAVVVNQGVRLTQALWEQCLWEMLFPLLRHAFHMSATSSKQEAEAALLGKSKGQQVRLVVHHSRNTEQKQWDETVVLALSGMSRLLRAHLPAIRSLDGMEAGWEEMMVVVESAIAGGRKEVALAAISFLSVVLGTHGGSDLISTEMWKRAMRSVDVGVEAATTSGCLVPLLVRTDMLGMIGNIYTALRTRFDDTDTLQVFDWVEAFCRNPWSEDDATSLIQTVGMPPVQKAALALIPALAPDHSPGLWPQYLRSMVRLVQPSHVVEQWKAEQAAAAAAAAALELQQQQQDGGGGLGGKGASGGGNAPQPPPKVSQSRYALNSAFLDKVMDLVVPAFEGAPDPIRAAVLPDLVEALGKCMEVRYTAYPEKIWRSAASTFNRVVPVALPAVASACSSPDPTLASDAMRTWSAIAEALENFLLGANTLHQKPTSTGLTTSSASSVSGGASGGGEKHLPVVPILDIPSSKPARGSSRRRGSKQGSQENLPALASARDASEGGQPAEPAIDPQLARADAELEVSVLDTLSDVVLTACSAASHTSQLRLVRIIDSGIVRPKSLSIQQPSQTVGSSFDHVCLRKMYALCSRGGGTSPDPDGSRLVVARLALPILVHRADHILRLFVEEVRPPSAVNLHNRDGAFSGGQGHGGIQEKPRLEEVMCVLEVLAGLTLAPEVADAALVPGEHLTQVVHALRDRPDVKARGRERTHLLLLYSSLCSCITCKEGKVREMAKDVLQLAGAGLGLGAPLRPIELS